MTTFTVKLLSPASRHTFTNVSYASIPTTDGLEGFMAHHQNDRYQVKNGQCNIRADSEYQITVRDGIATFVNNTLTISVFGYELSY